MVVLLCSFAPMFPSLAPIPAHLLLFRLTCFVSCSLASFSVKLLLFLFTCFFFCSLASFSFDPLLFRFTSFLDRILLLSRHHCLNAVVVVMHCEVFPWRVVAVVRT